MSSDTQPPVPVAPKPPTSEEFDLLHETAAHPFHAELWRRAMGPDYPADVDPSSSCSQSLLAHIHKSLALRSGDTLVDLGCGRGGPGLWLARESGARLIGIDFSPRAVSLASTLAAQFTLRVPAEFHVGSFEHTELPDASVQGLMSVDALPFAPDRDAALREVRRILEPGARAVFTATKPGDGQPSGTHNSRTWEERIEGAGLHVEHESSTRRRVRTSLRSGIGYTVSGANTRHRCVPLSAMRRPIACSQKHVSLVPRSQLDASWCSRCVDLRAEDGRVRRSAAGLGARLPNVHWS